MYDNISEKYYSIKYSWDVTSSFEIFLWATDLAERILICLTISLIWINLNGNGASILFCTKKNVGFATNKCFRCIAKPIVQKKTVNESCYPDCYSVKSGEVYNDVLVLVSNAQLTISLAIVLSLLCYHCCSLLLYCYCSVSFLVDNVLFENHDIEWYKV